MYTHIRPSEGASGHTLGVLGTKRWGAGRNLLMVCLLVSAANGPSLLTPCLQEYTATRAWNSNRKHALA